MKLIVVIKDGLVKMATLPEYADLAELFAACIDGTVKGKELKEDLTSGQKKVRV